MRAGFVALALGLALYDRGRRRGRNETLRAFIKLARAER